MAREKWEKRLGISTGAGDYEREDDHHSRYEPTPYAVLERLAGSGYITRESVMVDYGCGKGRVGFFLNHALGCRTIGVEYDRGMFEAAKENLERYAGRKANAGVCFVYESAESYRVGDADCFYFFNPFSLRILQAVIGRILESYYANPRTMRLFFYFALDDALAWLMTRDEMQLEDEIDCRDLFSGGDPKEKILIFRIG